MTTTSEQRLAEIEAERIKVLEQIAAERDERLKEINAAIAKYGFTAREVVVRKPKATGKPRKPRSDIGKPRGARKTLAAVEKAAA